jgi:tetratricopeptide (TPR) repeat protein
MILPLYGMHFAYDQAILLAQQGNWQEASHCLQHLLVNNPEDASLLYDTGVASFNMNDMEHAIAYFQQAAQKSGNNSVLQEKAWVNAGTAYAKNDNFDEAITCLEYALNLNPTNESTQKKLEEFKKKRDEKKQQEQQPEQNQKSKDSQDENQNQDQEQQNKEQKNQDTNDDAQTNNDPENQNNEEDQSSESNQDNNSDPDQKNEQKSNNNHNDQCNTQQQPHDTSSEKDDNQRHEQSNKDNRQKNSQQDTSSKQSDQYGNNQQSIEQSVENTQESSSANNMHAVPEELQKEENKWMHTLLEKYEQHDIEGNKRLLRGQLHQQGVPKTYEKNW